MKMSSDSSTPKCVASYRSAVSNFLFHTASGHQSVVGTGAHTTLHPMSSTARFEYATNILLHMCCASFIMSQIYILSVFQPLL